MTAIDWSHYPSPWREIGPKFARQSERISRGLIPEPDLRKITGFTLLGRRNQARLTRPVVAGRVGIPVHKLKLVEGGSETPGSPLIMRIAEAIEELLTAQKAEARP